MLEKYPLYDFFQVSTDYLLCRTELREHTNKSVSDLHLNDDAAQILTDEKYNPQLLSELLSHESFHKFMTDLEIYIDGFNDKGIQIANAFLDVMRYKLNELGTDSTDVFTKIFDTSHIETEQYYMNILLEDLKPIVSDLRNTHMKDSNTASDIDYQSMVKNIIDDFTSPSQIATEDTVEEKQTLKEIFSRSPPVLNFINDQSRQEKVIGCIAFFCKLLFFRNRSHRKC